MAERNNKAEDDSIDLEFRKLGLIFETATAVGPLVESEARWAKATTDTQLCVHKIFKNVVNKRGHEYVERVRQQLRREAAAMKKAKAAAKTAEDADDAAKKGTSAESESAKGKTPVTAVKTTAEDKAVNGGEEEVEEEEEEKEEEEDHFFTKMLMDMELGARLTDIQRVFQVERRPLFMTALNSIMTDVVDKVKGELAPLEGKHAISNKQSQAFVDEIRKLVLWRCNVIIDSDLDAVGTYAVAENFKGFIGSHLLT